jgi:hypothetical protein
LQCTHLHFNFFPKRFLIFYLAAAALRRKYLQFTVKEF